MTSSFSQSILPFFPHKTNILYYTNITTAPAQRSATLSTPSSSSSIVLNAEKETSTERGVSVDQDGKSNVWAIEPKMEVSTKSGEEKTKSALIAGAGLIVFAGIAGVALTNLPDPNLL